MTKTPEKKAPVQKSPPKPKAKSAPKAEAPATFKSKRPVAADPGIDRKPHDWWKNFQEINPPPGMFVVVVNDGSFVWAMQKAAEGATVTRAGWPGRKEVNFTHLSGRVILENADFAAQDWMIV